MIRRSWYPEKVIPLTALLENAFVHEKQLFMSRFDLIEFMAADFVDAGIFTEAHVMNILKRESVASFASAAPVLVLLLMHSEIADIGDAPIRIGGLL